MPRAARNVDVEEVPDSPPPPPADIQTPPPSFPPESHFAATASASGISDARAASTGTDNDTGTYIFSFQMFHISCAFIS